MITLMSKFLKFENIEEIKFTKVKENVFSISIKSDIECGGEKVENNTFEAGYCKINPTLELILQNETIDVFVNDGSIRSQSFNIPMNVQLLLNPNLKEFFTCKIK